jgi:hypothetical protein
MAAKHLHGMNLEVEMTLAADTISNTECHRLSGKTRGVFFLL